MFLTTCKDTGLTKGAEILILVDKMLRELKKQGHRVLFSHM